MNRSSLLRRLLAVPAALGLAAAGLVVTTAPAQAAPIGALSFFSGVNDTVFNSQDDTFSFQTSGACPTEPTLATNFLIRVSGPGLPAAPNQVNIQGNSAGSTVGSITAGPFTGPVQQTLSGFATAQAQPGGYLAAGTYTLELVCRTAFQSASLGEFVGQFTITGSGASSVVAAVVPAADTATVLTTAPVGTAVEGEAVTLTATVSNSDAPGTTPSGTVLFKDGGVAIGAAVPVNGSGVATRIVSNLSVGSHVITAEFTGGNGFNDSATAVGTTLVVTASTTVPVLVSPATLTGSIKVGGTAVCTTGTWTGATSYLVEVLRNGAVVQSSATDKDRVLAPADLGAAIACRVTATNGAGSASPSTTASSTVAAGSAAVATSKPKVVGKAKVGKTVRANRGTWSPAASYTYTYVWKRGAKVVKQGTGATSYKLTKKDKKKKITVTVQAKRTGYATGSATSAAVKVR
jgi:hypothetical protein